MHEQSFKMCVKNIDVQDEDCSTSSATGDGSMINDNSHNQEGVWGGDLGCCAF